jgi:hypothetical protein
MRSSRPKHETHQTDFEIPTGDLHDCGWHDALRDPAFYRRFGFENNSALRMEGIPPEFLMCLPMGESVPEGIVTHHPAFHAGE